MYTGAYAPRRKAWIAHALVGHVPFRRSQLPNSWDTSAGTRLLASLRITCFSKFRSPTTLEKKKERPISPFTSFQCDSYIKFDIFFFIPWKVPGRNFLSWKFGNFEGGVHQLLEYLRRVLFFNCPPSIVVALLYSRRRKDECKEREIFG